MAYLMRLLRKLILKIIMKIKVKLLETEVSKDTGRWADDVDLMKILFEGNLSLQKF